MRDGGRLMAKKPGAKMGRPLKELLLTAEEIEQYAKDGCTDSEIAALAGCSHDTLTARFSDELNRARAFRKHILRKKQFDLAEAGNVTMLIWLGKNDLGQKDQASLDITRRDITDLTDEELERVASGVPMAKVLSARAGA